MDTNEYEKLSKKKKRDLYPGKRTVWAIKPITEGKHRKRMDDPASVLSLLRGCV